MLTVTSRNPMKILFVEDDSSNRMAVSRLLRSAGHNVIEYANAEEVFGLSDTELLDFDAAILDQRLPGRTGKELGEFLSAKNGTLDLIMFTAFPGDVPQKAAEDVGFLHYIQKGVTFETLRQTLETVAVGASARNKVFAALRNPRNGGLVGRSMVIERVRREIFLYARTDTPVFILGDQGTGKELVAKAIKQHSKRAGKPYESVNCAAFTDTLIQSELFGYVRGAHNLALTNKEGLFQACDGGTLFLDEIGRLSPDSQGSLLRVLQVGDVRRVGSSATEKVDVRVIAATNMDPGRAIADGKLLPDLYQRLSVHVIKLPLLKERVEDIIPLASHFLSLYTNEGEKRFSDSVLSAFKTYHWPDNVRELENAVKNAVARSGERPAIIPSDLKPHILKSCDADYHPPEESVSLSGEKRGLRSTPAADTRIPYFKTIISEYLDTLNLHFPAAQKKRDPKKVRLQDIAAEMKVTHVVLSNFFNQDKKWRGIDGKLRATLRVELAKAEPPEKWKGLRSNQSPVAKHLR